MGRRRSYSESDDSSDDSSMSRSPSPQKSNKHRRQRSQSVERNRRHRSRSSDRYNNRRSRSPQKHRRYKSRSRSRSPKYSKRHRSRSPMHRSRSRSRSKTQSKRYKSPSDSPKRQKRRHSRSRSPDTHKHSKQSDFKRESRNNDIQYETSRDSKGRGNYEADRNSSRSGSHFDRGANSAPHHTGSGYKHHREMNGRSEEELLEFFDKRRQDREKIGVLGAIEVWGMSPQAELENSEASSASEDGSEVSSEDNSKKKKKRKKEKKSKKKKSKKKKKKHKKRIHSDGEEEPMWVEKTLKPVAKAVRSDSETSDSEDEETNFIGPVLGDGSEEIQSKLDYGKALLPGEGAAMAAYIADGKRIPRRGEIGLEPEEIEAYEKTGYVMSGSRHRRMEAVRLRKENQIYSADEKRALASFNYAERSKRENKILSQFKSLVHKKTSGKK
ncbi:unnamed protein product [Owenia fusiformis]|uniref:NF-kappa-B-activating protein C-terminal domain-containing protein n=1 Tax=Owenia fusiformis TaxID=6347 RepID=A0A8S4NJF0_OWEFU|nr:unnamed protein product [Owenia fusiformis]